MSGHSKQAMMIMAMVGLATSEIMHTSDAKQLIVPLGHYSQFRLIGNGI